MREQEPTSTTNHEPFVTKRGWLRWTVPPGISIVVHAVLIAIVAYIGMQISADSAQQEQVYLAELALPAPPAIPDVADPASETQPDEIVNQPAPVAKAVAQSMDLLETHVKALSTTPISSPAMDPVALAALREMNSQIAKPESASPPTVQFAGVQTNAARTIVYVVDGSGATANSFAYLQTQLLTSIDRLSATQRFQVVLFRSFEDQIVSLAPINNGSLARASIENKAIVSEWLNQISARGRSNPVDGLRTALALKPDLVLLITRSIERTEMGWAQGQREILQELNELNPQNARTGKRKTVIKTIQLLDEDPTGIMRAIGGLHGDGSDDYRVVTYEDLVSPDEPDDLAVRSIGASNEQRIANASQIMGNLIQSGAGFSLMYAYADQTHRQRALTSASQIRSLVSDLRGIDGRAALLFAQAQVLSAIASPGSIEMDELQQIIDTLGSVLYSEPSTDAQRQLIVARARELLGDLDGARLQIEELVALSADLGLDESTKAQALLARVSIVSSIEDLELIGSQPPFVSPSGNIDAVWGLILRESMTKSMLRSHDPNAWRPMVEVRKGALNSPEILGYIDSRITLILASAPSESLSAMLPSAVILAAANTMSHSIDQRENAIALFSQLADRQDDPQLAADALWRIGVLGHAINTQASRDQSASALWTLASRYPNDLRAPDAIAGAIHETSTQDQSELQARLQFGVDHFATHPEIDLWRLSLARLLSGFARLDVLDPVNPDSREGTLAGELYEQTVLGMLDEYQDPQTQRGLEIRMRDASLRFHLRGASLWTKRAALNQIKLDPESAIASIDQLIVEARAKNQPSDELELMRAQTLIRLGQTRTAFKSLSDLSARIDATGNHSSTYWQSWSIMLETISNDGSTKDKADARRHIARLQLIDPNLGGSPWFERITKVLKTLHSSS